MMETKNLQMACCSNVSSQNHVSGVISDNELQVYIARANEIAGIALEWLRINKIDVFQSVECFIGPWLVIDEYFDNGAYSPGEEHEKNCFFCLVLEHTNRELGIEHAELIPLMLNCKDDEVIKRLSQIDFDDLRPEVLYFWANFDCEGLYAQNDKIGDVQPMQGGDAP